MAKNKQSETIRHSAEQGADELAYANKRLEILAAVQADFRLHIFNKIVPQSIFLRYLLASAIFVVAFSIRWFALPLEAGPFILFYLAIVIASLLCGSGAGLMVAVLSMLAGDYFFISPYLSFTFEKESWGIIAFFVIFGVFVSLIIGKIQHSLASATKIRQQLIKTMAVLDNDIVARRQVSQYARSLLEASLDPLVTISPDGKIMDVNEATVTVTGVARVALIGSDFSSYFTEPDKARDGYQQVFTDGFVANYPLTIHHRNGKLTDVMYNASVYKDVAGKVLGVFAAARDITEQKQVSQYARSLLEASLDPLVTISPDGKIMDVNEATVMVTGVTRVDIIGSDFSSYFTEPDKARDGYQQVFTNGFVANYPLTIHHQDGKLTDVMYNASVYKDVAGKVLGVFAAARDITERRLIENTLLNNLIELKSAKSIAEKANLAKSEFLSSMSHELRTPLNAVLGFAQLMDSGMPSPVQKMSIDQILKAGWHLLDLINEILDLAVIESGNMSMSLEPISLGLVLQDCQAMILPQAQKRGIVMIFPPPEQSCYVRADATRLKQVMINLLSNAIKYNRVNGTVNVQYVISSENRVRVSVIDTGHGLTPEQVAQLFQPFNRLGREAGKEEGSGIGLVVTRQLMELMGGTVNVESSVGVGSMFWIELDIAPTPEFLTHDATKSKNETFEISLPAPLPKQRTILYVEDEPANLLLVEQLIARSSNLKLLSAINGAQGVAMACALQPDLILMDINMPGVNGYDALSLLRENPATAHITVIALSANAMPLDIQKGLKAGFFSYLTKPIKIDEFIEALDVALLHLEKNAVQSKNTKGESGLDIVTV